MKNLFWTVALALTPTCLAVPITDLAACEVGEVYIGGYPTALSYRWTVPGQFPIPSKLQVVNGAWELDCPTYSARSDGQKVIFSSKTDRPEDALHPFRKGWDFYLNGYYKYPALQQEWVQFKLSLALDAQAGITGTGVAPTGVVAGYRQADSELKPYAFEGAVTPFVAPTDQKLEIFLKTTPELGSPSWAYVQYDPAKKILTLERLHPFPEK